MTKVLNEKQQKFMAVLFDEAGGDVTLAKKLAGYSDTTATSHVIKGLKDEIADATKEYMARVAPRAAMALVKEICWAAAAIDLFKCCLG